MDYFKALKKAMNFVPVISLAIQAFADNKLEPGEIITIVDNGLDAIGVKGLDDSDVYVVINPDGSFSVEFSAKAAQALSISF